MVKFILQYLSVTHSLKLHQLFNLIWSTNATWWSVSLTYIFQLEWPWLGRNGYIYITVPIGATFIKLAPTVHLDMIYWWHMVICVLDLHFMPEWPWLGRSGYVYITWLWVLHSPNLHQLFILTWSTDARWWFVSLRWPRHTMAIAGPLSWFPSH